jgi:hypothetical protein
LDEGNTCLPNKYRQVVGDGFESTADVEVYPCEREVSAVTGVVEVITLAFSKKPPSCHSVSESLSLPDLPKRQRLFGRGLGVHDFAALLIGV